MITGIVTSTREAVISLTVHGPNGQEQEIEAVIDTGFNGSLTLPTALITALELPWRRRGRALLADGNESVVEIYEATVIWDGTARRISVDEVDVMPLVGMALLYGYELTVQIVEGGRILLKPLP
ncbi:MAG: clan AA aspartic protease [Deltaproteobacteria bacterium]|nr:clan AA aspartic protease [Deltaproteobacteria bacterium]